LTSPRPPSTPAPCDKLTERGGGSSAGKSSGLIIRRSWVQAPPAPPSPGGGGTRGARSRRCARRGTLTPPPSSAGVDFGSAAAIQSDLVVLRRRLHGTPELGNDLRQTQAAVLRALEGLPPEVTTGRALGSVVAVLRGSLPEGAQRPTVLLRGDMHTAGLVGAAR